MRRVILGWLILVHAFAHTFAGEWSSAKGSFLAGSVVWALAFLAYLSAGLGLLRVPLARRWWQLSMLVATAASLLMLFWYRPPWGLFGVAIDAALLVLTLGILRPHIDADIAAVDALGDDAMRHPRWVRAGWTFAVVAAAYAGVVMVMRPVFLRWGTTPEERVAALPGDQVHPAAATYRIDHAITIHAPPSAIWPWMVQLGQDRAGFYSYDWLERSAGDRVRNADEVRSEWQRLAVGDTILAVQRDYLGGKLGTLGWRVNVLEPERVIGLENWGTFVLRPVDSATTRLIVRTRGAGGPSLAAFVFAPVTVFVFEPAHFIMERGMLRGIRDRVERAERAGRAG